MQEWGAGKKRTGGVPYQGFEMHEYSLFPTLWRKDGPSEECASPILFPSAFPPSFSTHFPHLQSDPPPPLFPLQTLCPLSPPPFPPFSYLHLPYWAALVVPAAAPSTSPADPHTSAVMQGPELGDDTGHLHPETGSAPEATTTAKAMLA